MAVELSADQIRRVLQGISVPPQPQIMVDLQMEQVMPVPDLKAIARLISQDPGLSGALLKIGLSQYGQRDLDAAETTLTQVGSQYPGTDAARTAADRLRAIQLSRLR